MRAALVVVGIGGIFGLGCGGEGAEPGVEGEPSVLEAELGGGRVFEVAPSGGEAELTASGVTLAGPTVFELNIEGGTAGLSMAEGTLEVEGLEIAFSGIGHPVVEGVVLDEMILVLDEPSEISVETGDDVVTGVSTLPLRVDWWLSTEGEAIPLESQKVESLAVTFQIERDGDGLRLDVQMSQDTSVFFLDGVLDVESLDVDVTARTP